MLSVECPRCGAAMQQETFDGHLDRSVVIDICHACQCFWFDARESTSLTPGSTLALFRVIGEKLMRPQHSNAELAKCPRCKGRLRRTQDMQRSTRFEYLNCPNGHGRLISFFDFLREKDFIRPLTPHQIAQLRENVGSVNCANCGGPVDLAKGAACSHCGTPLSMLDMKQAEKLVAQLQKAEVRAISRSIRRCRSSCCEHAARPSAHLRAFTTTISGSRMWRRPTCSVPASLPLQDG